MTKQEQVSIAHAAFGVLVEAVENAEHAVEAARCAVALGAKEEVLEQAYRMLQAAKAAKNIASGGRVHRDGYYCYGIN